MKHVQACLRSRKQFSQGTVRLVQACLCVGNADKVVLTSDELM